MKRLIIGLSLMLAFVYNAGAQKSMLKEAKSALAENQYDKAWESIQAALLNDETKVMPETWFLKGKILQTMVSADPKYKTIVDNPVVEIYDSYMKAIELDPKKKINKSIDLMAFTFSNLAVNTGVEAYKAGNSKKAFEMFEMSLKISEWPVFNGAVDTAIVFYTGIAAIKVENFDRAIELLNKCVTMNYAGSDAYSYLRTAYMSKGDTANAFNTLQKAFEKFPNDLVVLVDMVNFYMVNNRTTEALEYLNKAKEKDPTNVSFYFAEGTLYEKMNDKDKAITAYKKAIEVDSTYFNSYYNLGVVYYNEAKKIFDDANSITDNNLYNKEIEKGKDALRKALPFMEKANNVDPTDKSAMESMKTIYFRLEMMDKYKEMKQKLEQ
jgi:tetratricopeptide (TPR) repeat protein